MTHRYTMVTNGSVIHLPWTSFWLQYLLEIKLYTHWPNDAYVFNVTYGNILYILLQPKFSVINS